jgi:hypothetical protein
MLSLRCDFQPCVMVPFLWPVVALAALAALLTHHLVASSHAEVVAPISNEEGSWYGAGAGAGSAHRAQATGSQRPSPLANTSSSTFPNLTSACSGQAASPTCVLVNVTINMTAAVGGVVDVIPQSLVLSQVQVLAPPCEAGPNCENGQWDLQVAGNLTLGNGTMVQTSSAEIVVRDELRRRGTGWDAPDVVGRSREGKGRGVVGCVCLGNRALGLMGVPQLAQVPVCPRGKPHPHPTRVQPCSL